MKIAFKLASDFGRAKNLLLSQALKNAISATGHFISSIEEADLVLLFENNIPTEAINKKGIVLNSEFTYQNPTQAILKAIEEAKPLNENVIKSFKVVAITACPTGVAHTFLSAKAIENYCKEKGYQIKVETRGQEGAANKLSKEEIQNADLVFVATDINVDLEEFAGKKMYRTSTNLALHKTEQEFEKALNQATIHQVDNSVSQPKTKSGVYKHLMTGVSHMLPIVVAGGLLIAISFMFGIEAFKDENLAFGIPKALMDIGGGSAFKLIIAVFAGYVAYSIADRPGLAVGLIAGMLTSTAGAGILGGIVAGFLAGYVVKMLNMLIQLPPTFASLKPILILPFFGSLIVGMLMLYAINPPVVALNESLTTWLNGLGATNNLVLGLILGAMMCIDMGGPINKAAYIFGTGLLASGVNIPMASVMAAGMVPPIGMAIATWIAKHKFDQNEKNAGNAGFVLGLCFISEGALPFVAADPFRVIISSVIGGAVAGAYSGYFSIGLPAPHGGIFVVLLTSNPIQYILAISIGSIVTGLLYSFLKPKR